MTAESARHHLEIGEQMVRDAEASYSRYGDSGNVRALLLLARAHFKAVETTILLDRAEQRG